MRTRVKICGITRHDDAREAVERGADALGFICWRRSPRFVEPERIAEIASRLPGFVTPVTVFVNPTAEEVCSVLESCPAATLQFHGEEGAAFCAQFRRPWIKTARARAGLDLVEYFSPFNEASAWLIDAFHERHYGGTGNPFDWNLVPRSLANPMILSGGLSPDNVAEAIALFHPYAVDVSSGVELDKGIKNAARIAAFMDAVRRADAETLEESYDRFAEPADELRREGPE